MRLLLDTQIAIWWQIRPENISAATQSLVQSADAVFVSRASLWEMAIKCGLGKLDIDLPLFCEHIDKDGFQWLDIRHQHILALMQLPQFDDHRDPFDRLLITQSLVEPMIFLTADAKLTRYGGHVRMLP
jgi:PIN domain nuclease of toxin-antitoxin system